MASESNDLRPVDSAEQRDSVTAEQAEADALWDELTRRPESDGLAKAVAAGLVAAIITAGVWAAIATATGFELGIIAIALGAFVGLAVGESAAYRSKKVETAAVAIAIGGLLIAKILVTVFAFPAQLAGELSNDPELFHNIQFNDRLLNGQAPAEVANWYETAPANAEPPPELASQIVAIEDELEVAAHRMSDDERDAFARRYVDKTISTIPWSRRIRFSIFDIIWLVLAVGAARRIASGDYGE